MPCCDCASMCSTARRDLERRGAWRSPSHIRNSVPIILHGIWTGCLTFATSIRYYSNRVAVSPRVHARVCRSVSGIRTQPGPPRSHARSGWPARRSACRCRRGRVAVLGPSAAAPPGRSLNRQGPASSGSVALSVSRALPVRQSPRAARRRRPESGLGATVSPCRGVRAAAPQAAAAAKLRCRVCGVSARNQHTPRRRPGRRDERRPHLKATPRTVPQRRTPDTWTVFDMVTTGIILDMSTCIR
jgi:hypothetical protein